MAISHTEHAETLVSGSLEGVHASIALTPQMFELLSAGVYEDRILAIIREVSCNARDAMKEHSLNLGVDVSTLPKMEVWVPTAFEPTLHIRDYGTGLTKEQVFEIFLSYGMSTKTSSNELIGMFGIGSKSPLSYTDSFLVTSYKDGEMTMYNVYKDKGIPNIVKMGSTPTTEANGLKITVAVRSGDYYVFQDRIRKFFRLFDFPVEFKNIEITNPVVVLEDNPLFKVVSGYENGVFAVMGGVPYSIPADMQTEMRAVVKATTILLPFNVGELNVASSRENLSFVEGDRTDTILKQRIKDVTKNYAASIERAVDSAKNWKEAFDIMMDSYNMTRTSWRKYDYDIGYVKYKGVAFNDFVDTYKDKLDKLDAGLPSMNRTYKKRATAVTTVSLSLYDAIYAASKNSTGYFASNRIFLILEEDIKKGFKSVLREIALQEGVDVLTNVSTEAKEIITELFGAEKIMVWKASEVVELYKSTKAKVTRKKVSGVFEYSGVGSWKAVEEMDDNDDNFYVEMFRDSVVGLDNGVEFNHSTEPYKLLVRAGLVSKLYFIRGTANKKSLSPALKLLDQTTIRAMIKRKFGRKHRKMLICKTAMSFISIPFWVTRLAQKGDLYVSERGCPTINFFVNKYDKWLAKNEKELDNLSNMVKLYREFFCGVDGVDKHSRRAVKRFSREVEVLKNKFDFLISSWDAGYYFKDTTKGKMEKIAELVAKGELVL